MDATALDTYRLPTDIIPVHYDLKIRTDLETLVFDGAVAVTIRFTTDTPTVVLNVFELELGAASLVVGEETLKPTSQVVNSDTQRVTLSFAKDILRGSEAVLCMTFGGKLQNMGYFKSEWLHDGKTDYYSATFFEVRLSLLTRNGTGSIRTCLAYLCAARVPVLGRTGAEGYIRDIADITRGDCKSE
jgi:hypothetical protein